MHSKILRTLIGISAPKKCWNIKQMLISTMEDENVEIKWVKHLNLHLTHPSTHLQSFSKQYYLL